MTHRRVPQSVFAIDYRGPDLRRQLALRMLWQGWTVEAASTLTGLPIATVREIASTLSADDFTSEAPPP
jgi:hypothetical protein